MTSSLTGLYLVTPDWDDTAQLLQVTEQALQGGVRLLQYRHKTASAALQREQAVALQQLCRQYACPFVINDHLTLCQELDADGVHVGATDAGVAQARRTLGPDKIVGASCYGDLALALAAQADGASYVAFGGFYPSRVKRYPVTTPVTLLSEATAQMNLPKVVIGGMTAANAVPLVQEGAQMVAAISSVYQAPDPQQAARQFAMLF